MNERVVQRLAEAVRGHSKKVAGHDRLDSQVAVVKKLKPLTVEVTQTRMVLEDDADLALSQSVRRYERDFGLKLGDTVMVVPVGSGDWIVSQVISDKHTFQGATTSIAVVGGSMGGGTVVGGVAPPIALAGKVEFHDKDGEVIGYLPLLPP